MDVTKSEKMMTGGKENHHNKNDANLNHHQNHNKSNDGINHHPHHPHHPNQMNRPHHMSSSNNSSNQNHNSHNSNATNGLHHRHCSSPKVMNKRNNVMNNISVSHGNTSNSLPQPLMSTNSPMRTNNHHHHHHHHHHHLRMTPIRQRQRNNNNSNHNCNGTSNNNNSSNNNHNNNANNNNNNSNNGNNRNNNHHCTNSHNSPTSSIFMTSSSVHYAIRRQKWILRLFLVLGGMLYFIIMIRGTQLIVQHSNNMTYNEEEAGGVPPTTNTATRKTTTVHQQHHNHLYPSQEQQDTQRPNLRLPIPLPPPLLPPLIFGSSGTTAAAGGIPIEQQQQQQQQQEHQHQQQQQDRQQHIQQHNHQEHQRHQHTLQLHLPVARRGTVTGYSNTDTGHADTSTGNTIVMGAGGQNNAETSQRYLAAKRQTSQTISQRAYQRRQQTRPPNPKNLKTMSSTVFSDPFLLLRQQQHHYQQQPLVPPTLSGSPSPSSIPRHAATTATIQELCGIHARNASLQHPNMYLRRDALNSHSRVIVTGILSNPVAWHLALYLKQRCGVQYILGVDSQYHSYYASSATKQQNTLSKRLQYLHPYQILATNIPQLQQPILIPLTGLDPKRKKTDNKKPKPKQTRTATAMQTSLQEYDWMAFQPTHIVHLATAYTPNSATDTATTHSEESECHWKNIQSPYVSSEYDPPLFAIRTSMTSIEQLLTSIVHNANTTAVTPSITRIHNYNTTMPSTTPHFTFASSSLLSKDSSDSYSTPPTSTNNDKYQIIHRQCKLMDEVLANTYRSLFQTYSVGLRLPSTIYGPWDTTESRMHQFFLNSILTYANTTFSTDTHTITETDASESSLVIQNALYIQDAVEALVAAMQFRSDQATTFDVPSSHIPISDAKALVQSFLGGNEVKQNGATQNHQQQTLNNTNNRTLHYLGWKPTTSVRLGFLKSLAWHLDQLQPYGPPPTTRTNDDNYEDTRLGNTSYPPSTSGDSLLLRHNVSTCPGDDVVCHTSRQYLPCISECSNKHHCLPSIWDDVWELTRNMTEGCDAVLYTQSLGKIPDLSLQAQYEDDESKFVICNIAFVNRDSPMVQAVVSKVPPSELKKLGVVHNNKTKTKTKTKNSTDNDIGFYDECLDKLNGRLLYRGWILIWVDVPQTSVEKETAAASTRNPTTASAPAAGNNLTTADKFLLKLNPGRMFSRDASYAVFVDENFAVSPTIDDIRFLIGQMHRSPFPQRSVTVRDTGVDEKSGIENIGNKKFKKIKYTVPAEPERRASILLSQLKIKLSTTTNNKQQEVILPKISVVDATKFMRFEIGHNISEKEPLEIKRQRDFYKQLPSYLNSKDLRPLNEPIYKYEFKHWIRSRWIVHDLRLEHSRLLRCDWYQEHVQWSNDLDQLSFAAIMAQREVTRRMKHNEMDDHLRSKFEAEHNSILRQVSDANEWYGMDDLTTATALLQHHHQAPEMIPDHVVEDDQQQEISDDVVSKGDSSASSSAAVGTSEILMDTASMTESSSYFHRHREAIEAPLYVRIISDRIMSISRKAWAKQQQQLSQTQNK